MNLTGYGENTVVDTTQSQLPASNPAYWQLRWQEGRTGWDLGGIHKLFPELLAAAQRHGLAAGSAIIEPGCGRAHTSAALARMGYQTTAFDVSADAVAEAKKLYAEVSGLQIAVADVFQLPEKWTGSFDALYDRAVMNALPAEVRVDFVRACAAVLKPGGLLLTLPFTVLNIDEQDGPPFAINESGLQELLSGRFECIHHDERQTQEDSKIAAEMIAVWRKKKG